MRQYLGRFIWAHNLKVAGSNPAPAPNLSLVTARLRGILVFIAGVATHRKTAVAPPLEVGAGPPVGFPKLLPPVTRRGGRRHEGDDVGRDRDQVVPGQLRDDGQHKRSGWSPLDARLQIVELPHQVARRPPLPPDSGHIGQSHEFRPVARGARAGFPGHNLAVDHGHPSSRDQILSFLDTAHGHMGHEPRARIAQALGLLLIFRPLKNSPRKGLGPRVLDRRKRLPAIRVLGTGAVSMPRVHGVQFIAPKCSAAALISSSVMAFASTPVVGVAGVRGSADTRALRRKSSLWRMNDDAGSPATGAFFRPPLAGWQVTRGGPRGRGPKTGGAVGDDIQHRRMVPGKAVDPVASVAPIDPRIRRRALGHIPQFGLLGGIFVRAQFSRRHRQGNRLVARCGRRGEPGGPQRLGWVRRVGEDDPSESPSRTMSTTTV